MKPASGIRSSNYCLFAVSCPPELLDMSKWIFGLPSRLWQSLSDVLLMLSGDIESNPGPMAKAEAEAFALVLERLKKLDEAYASILETTRKLEEGRVTLLEELDCSKEREAAAENVIKLLTERVAALETRATDEGEAKTAKEKEAASLSEVNRLNERIATLETSIANQRSDEVGTPGHALDSVSQQLSLITSRCDDAENRLRRSNLLFFGLEDDPDEDWAASEQKIIQFCSNKLDITATSTQFERVHRLGKYGDNKRRPIIAKFTSFKDKVHILSCARKLKGTCFSIGEDFSLTTRRIRKKLYAFAKAQNKPFWLSFDKLHMGARTFVYDTSTDSVVPSSR